MDGGEVSVCATSFITFIDLIVVLWAGQKIYSQPTVPSQVYLHYSFLFAEIICQCLVCACFYFVKTRSKEDLLVFSAVQYAWVVFGGLGFFMISYQFYAGSKLII